MKLILEFFLVCICTTTNVLSDSAVDRTNVHSSKSAIEFRRSGSKTTCDAFIKRINSIRECYNNEFKTLPEKLKINYEKYYNWEELSNMLKQLESDWPNLMKLQSLGTSVDGRSIWAAHITPNVQKERELLKPMFKYVANMHGDETVGYAMMVTLIQYLVKYYNRDARIKKLLDTTDIYIVPSMNPDGFNRSKEESCKSLEGYIGRTNANGVDLNRNFPDQYNDIVQIELQPETKAMIAFIEKYPFVLSANFHGGAIVVSYPFDNAPSEYPKGIENGTPDSDLFKYLASTYSKRNPDMRKEYSCGFYFKDGITNGYSWYALDGGMQDFNYVQSNCLDITIELSCCKYPKSDTLSIYWHNNKESLLTYMEQVHIGIYGLVIDTNENVVPNAKIYIIGQSRYLTVTDRGEYWKLLLPGNYTLYIEAEGYQSQEENVFLESLNEKKRVDFILTNIDS